MFTQKYTIVQFIETIPAGYSYSSDNWPLHSTVIDTFAVNWCEDEMMVKLRTILQTLHKASSEAENDRFFGVNKEIQVTLLKKTFELAELHENILSVLENGGLVLNDPQFARNGFLPHATVQKHARLTKGDSVEFTALSVVDMFQKNDPYQRKVLSTINIGNT